jgi:hypothetical protein
LKNLLASGVLVLLVLVVAIVLIVVEEHGRGREEKKANLLNKAAQTRRLQKYPKP